MKATFLGTGCAMVLKRYNTCFLLEEDTSKLLVDAGGGSEILIRLDKLGIPVTALGGMFVTHSHSDHILGTPWVIRAVATAMAEEGYTGTFTVAACQRTLSDIRTICEMILGKKLTKFFDSQILFRQVTDGEELDLAGFHITAFDIGSKKMQQFGFLLDLRMGSTSALPVTSLSSPLRKNTPRGPSGCSARPTASTPTGTSTSPTSAAT